MSSSTPRPIPTPEQLRRLSAALSPSASPVDPEPLRVTPSQLARKAQNKAAAHRIRATKQLAQATAASIVAAAVGTGESASDELLATVEKDVLAMQLAYRTRTTTGAITGVNPFTGGTEAPSQGSQPSRSSEPSSRTSDPPSVGGAVAAPVLEEAVLWIYENLRFQLHPNPELHNSLLAVAIKAGDRLGSMHPDHLFMQDYRGTFEERCASLPQLRFSSIPGGKLKGGKAQAALEDAIARSSDVGYWKALTRHLLGLKLLRADSAERALLTLFEVEIPRRPDDPTGARWHEEFLTRDLHLSRLQVREFFTSPLARQRAFEGVIPILLLRYAHHLEGASNYIPLDWCAEDEADNGRGIAGALDQALQDRLQVLERKCKAQAQALQEARDKIETIKEEGGASRRQPRAPRAARRKEKETVRARKARKPGEGRDTRADARYSSDETEGSDCDEYSQNSHLRYDSFLVPDGKDEEEYDPSESDEELSTVTGTTGTRKGPRGGSLGKSSHTSRSTLPPPVRTLLADPSPEMRKDLRWEFEENRKLVSYWEHAIDYYRDPTMMDSPHILRLVREIRTNRGLLLADLQGHLYTVHWNTTVNVRKYNPRQGCSPIANPDKCDRIAMASAEQMLDNHMYPRCHASFMEFLLQMKDQALKPSRIRFRDTGEERQGHIRHYETLIKQQVGEVFPSERPHAYHTNELHVSRWSLLLSFHIKQWMQAVTQADLSALTRRFREHWHPYEKALLELGRLDNSGFLLHLDFLGYHCRLCGRLSLVATCCDNPRCTNVKAGISQKSPAGLGYQLVSEAEYTRRLEDWHSARLASWKAEGGAGTQPKKDKSVFTKEVKISSRPRDCTPTEQHGILQYRLQQDRLPYFTWDERGGFDLVNDH